jgi:hypothetical protein
MPVLKQGLAGKTQAQLSWKVHIQTRGRNLEQCPRSRPGRNDRTKIFSMTPIRLDGYNA